MVTEMPPAKTQQVEVEVTVDHAVEAKELKRIADLHLTNITIDTPGHTELDRMMYGGPRSPTAEVRLEGIPAIDGDGEAETYTDSPSEEKEKLDKLYPGTEDDCYETYRSVIDRIDHYEECYDVVVRELVLGLPQRNVLASWIDEYEKPPNSLAEMFAVEDVIIVPGPQIHPVVPLACWTDIDDS
mgnify:CR=1 FL=1